MSAKDSKRRVQDTSFEQAKQEEAVFQRRAEIGSDHVLVQTKIKYTEIPTQEKARTPENNLYNRPNIKVHKPYQHEIKQKYQVALREELSRINWQEMEDVEML
ncbi:hypothetical protein ILUMI_26899 [Ignelater luminosus]|uniref:Uncharacterized protein n=1 Tax=Ignelater luminosus TaxID=2038154 RepID=A0A8K0FYQ0_IGNLU|nr:hypothetical protein ILUMI_26899 [Ignelater luminosus]